MKLSKSKLALAKVINENGGWPERALWAVQDNCIAFFLGGKPEYKSGDRCWYSNSIDGTCVGTITCDEKVTNWHQTILSREEYYHAYPKADADEWIAWKGGECPVDKYARIDIRMTGGTTHYDTDTHWGWNADSFKITHYRLHNPEQSEPEFCKSVVRSIPEPEINSKNIDITQVDDINVVESKPTTEQLASDYRDAKDYAERKQQEADEAKAAADAALGELERAGEALGLLIGIAKQDQEPELVITEWRDLMVGDEISVFDFEDPSYNSDKKMALSDGLCVVTSIDGGVYIAPIAIADVHLKYWDATGADACEFKFIRRP